MTKPTRPDRIDYEKYRSMDQVPFTELPGKFCPLSLQLDPVFEAIDEKIEAGCASLEDEISGVAEDLAAMKRVSGARSAEVTETLRQLTRALAGCATLTDLADHERVSNEKLKSLAIAQKTEHDACVASHTEAAGSLDIRLRNTSTEIDSIQARIGNTNRDIAELGAEIAHVETWRGNVTKRLSDLELANDLVGTKISAVEAENKEARRQIWEHTEAGIKNRDAMAHYLGKRFDALSEQVNDVIHTTGKNITRIQAVDVAHAAPSSAVIDLGADLKKLQHGTAGVRATSTLASSLEYRVVELERRLNRPKPTRLRAAAYRIFAAVADIVLDAIDGDFAIPEEEKDAE